MKNWRVCPLCERQIPPGEESKHHLTPKAKGGAHGPIAIMHVVCHGKLHSVFTETQLARSYNTIEALLAHEEIGKFVRWVKKRPPGFCTKNSRKK